MSDNNGDSPGVVDPVVPVDPSEDEPSNGGKPDGQLAMDLAMGNLANIKIAMEMIHVGPSSTSTNEY